MKNKLKMYPPQQKPQQRVTGPKMLDDTDTDTFFRY